MSNQNKYSIIKLGLKSVVILSLAIVFLPLNAKAQLSFQAENSKDSRRLSLVESKFSVHNKKEETEPEEEPLDFSSSGRSGQQTAGESRGSCPQMDFPLTAIAPKSNISQTITTHPRWWFFLPYSAARISKVEFVLQDEGRNDLVRNTLLVPESLPYFSTTIPNTHPGIETDRWYRWYLKVYCLDGENTVPLFVSGWVQKIRLESQEARLVLQSSSLNANSYARQGLWLDAVNLLMKTQISDPSGSHLSKVWREIISSPEIDLEIPLPAKANIVIKSFKL